MNVNNIIKQAEERASVPVQRERLPLEWEEVHTVTYPSVRIIISATKKPLPFYSLKVCGAQGGFIRPRIVRGSTSIQPSMVENSGDLAMELHNAMQDAVAWINEQLANKHKEFLAQRVERDQSRSIKTDIPRKTGKTERDRAKKARKG